MQMRGDEADEAGEGVASAPCERQGYSVHAVGQSTHRSLA